MSLFDTGSLTLKYATARLMGSRARAIRAAALFAGAFILAYAASSWYEPIPLFFIVRPDFMLAFVRSTLSRPTWLSIWALLDGNYAYGTAAPVIDRFSQDVSGEPYTSQLPWPIIHLAFLGLLLFVYTRRINWRDPITSVALSGLTVNLLLLWSKGFSGQFIVYVLPFIILLMPDLRGTLYAGLLSAIWVAEWPIAFNMLQGQNWIVIWIVIARTAVLIALCLEYAARLFPSPAHGRVSVLARLASRTSASVLLLGWISLGPVAVASVGSYTQARVAADSAAPALDLIRDNTGARSQVIVFAQSRLFRRLYPAALRIGSPTLLPVFTHVPEPARVEWLNDIAAQGPFWFIADEGDPETLDANRRAEARMSEYACKIETTPAGSARVSRFVGMPENPVAIETSAVFSDEIELIAAHVSQTTLRPDSGLCVELNWHAITTPSGDYTVFVHLLDAQGRLVALNDQPPQGGFAPTSGWMAGSTLADRHGLSLPLDFPPGEYALQVGLYRSDDQALLPITHGASASLGSSGIRLTTLDVVR